MMHPHRFPHLSRPGNALQKWHKDSYWGTYRTRSHRPNLVMAMYYPQDTPLELGPTAGSPTQPVCDIPFVLIPFLACDCD